MQPKPLWLVPSLALGAVLLAPHATQAFRPNNIRVGFPEGDWFTNYDYDSKSEQTENVDWPVTMLWINQASINRVKDYLINTHGWVSEGGTLCNDKVLNTYETSNVNKPDWDGDCGVTWNCEYVSPTESRKMHTRLYAPTDNPYNDQWYSTQLGYYIVGTTHYDKNHSGCGSSGPEQFGWSEDVEQRIAAMADAECTVLYNQWIIYNDGTGPYDWDSQAYHQSGGDASEVQFVYSGKCA